MTNESVDTTLDSRQAVKEEADIRDDEMDKTSNSAMTVEISNESDDTSLNSNLTGEEETHVPNNDPAMATTTKCDKLAPFTEPIFGKLKPLSDKKRRQKEGEARKPKKLKKKLTT